METLEKIRNHVVNLELDAIRRTVQEALDAGIPAIQILTEGLSKGVEIVGKKFEGEEYFLSELIMAGETMKAGVAVLDPHLKKEAVKSLGTIVLGTMKGDIHGIGKNIFGTLARSGGFNVVDLGVDVSADKFVETAKKNNADIIATSSLLTITMVYIAEVVKLIEQSKLRSKVKIIMGGAPIDDDYAKKLGADAGVNDGVQGVEICRSWM